jgi:hypothetical protein
MMRARLLGMIVLFAGGSLLLAQDEDKLKPGQPMPGAFECYNVNGPAKGRPRCLVCQFGQRPSVIVFAKAPTDEKDAAFDGFLSRLDDILKKLDDTAQEFTDREFSAGVVILSPHARDSGSPTLSDEKEKKDLTADELAKEAVNREKLIERLEKRAKDLKHVIVATYLPPGPPKYDLEKDAEITVLFYERMKIRNKFVFAPDKLEAKDVEAIIKGIHESLSLKKKAL